MIFVHQENVCHKVKKSRQLPRGLDYIRYLLLNTFVQEVSVKHWFIPVLHLPSAHYLSLGDVFSFP